MVVGRVRAVRDTSEPAIALVKLDLPDPVAPRQGRHHGPRRQTPSVGGLREDVAGLGELFAQTELLAQVDRPGQVLKNHRKV